MSYLSTKHFEFRDLRYFQAISETGHMGKAAKLLNLSQPALTKSVRRLEDTFGAALLERHGRRIKITPVGELLVAQARILHRQTEDLLRVVDDYAKGASGTVKIGTGPISAELLLPEVCTLLLRQFRDVKIEVTTGLMSDVLAALKAGEFDMIVATLTETDADLLFYPLVDDELIVVARKAHPVFGETIRISDLLNYHWALPSPVLHLRQRIDAMFDVRDLPKPTVQIEVNSISLLPAIVEQTDLLSFISRQQLRTKRWASHLRDIPLREAVIQRRLGVLFRKEGYLSPAARSFLDFLQTHGPKLLGP